MKKRALISVFDKTGVLEFAKFLYEKNIEIISTGGTIKYLKENGLNIIEISEVTNLKEMLDGRLKTLHPNIHGGILAIRDNEDLIEKHFIDSLIVHKKLPIREGNVIDIGTGAGFPGMVLAICNPNINFTLMDSVGKKTKFLEEIKTLLSLKNVEVINGRAEDFIKERRETYDLGLCRGVNRLNVILEYVVPFIKENGIFFFKNNILKKKFHKHCSLKTAH